MSPVALATRASRKAVSDDLARIEAELQALRVRLKIDRDIAPGRIKRDLANAVAAISEARKRIPGAAAGGRS